MEWKAGMENGMEWNGHCTQLHLYSLCIAGTALYKCRVPWLHGLLCIRQPASLLFPPLFLILE